MKPIANHKPNKSHNHKIYLHDQWKLLVICKHHNIHTVYITITTLNIENIHISYYYMY